MTAGGTKTACLFFYGSTMDRSTDEGRQWPANRTRPPGVVRHLVPQSLPSVGRSPLRYPERSKPERRCKGAGHPVAKAGIRGCDAWRGRPLSRCAVGRPGGLVDRDENRKGPPIAGAKAVRNEHGQGGLWLRNAKEPH